MDLEKDVEQLEALLKLMQAYQVASLELEREGLRIKLDMIPSHPAPSFSLSAPHLTSAAPAPAAAPASSAGGAEGGAGATAARGEIVKAPMVATFYEAATPGAPPFVSVGSRVQRGQVLCILEAMKLMNELESDVNGTVAEVYVTNAQPVQFGQPLYRITPD